MRLSPTAGNILLALEECGEDDIVVLSWLAHPRGGESSLLATVAATRELYDFGLVELREYLYFGPQKRLGGPLDFDAKHGLAVVRERLAQNALGEPRWSLSDADDLAEGVVRVRLCITKKGLSEVRGD